jgi:uncharacterized membrane protein YfcA
MPPDPSVFITLVAIAGCAGFVDSIAGGGGLLTVPALLAAGLPPVSAIATNKLQSVFGTSSATYAFARRGHVDFRAAAIPALGSFLGSMAGAVVLQSISPHILSGVMPLVLIVIAGYFLLSPKISELESHRLLGPLPYALVAAAIGFYDGFFGPGAGSFFAISMVALMGMGIIRATGHTKLFNAASNLGALSLMAAGGHIVWSLGLAMAAANIAGAQLGSRSAMRFGAKLIKPLLATISVVMAVKLLLDPANPIAQLVWRR